MNKQMIIPTLLLSGVLLTGCATQDGNLSAQDELARYEAHLEQTGQVNASHELADAASEEAGEPASTDSPAGTPDAEVYNSTEEIEESEEMHEVPTLNESEESATTDTSSEANVPEEAEEAFLVYLESYYTEEQVLEWINTASSTELQQVSGIGEVTASKIIEFRDYSNAQEVVDQPNGVAYHIFNEILSHLGLV